MELILNYNTDSSESSGSELESNLAKNSVRKVYLVTYSQANKNKFPNRVDFANALVQCFQHSGVDVLHWCCSEENHNDGGKHYHVALKLKKQYRWNACKRLLKERYGIIVNFSNKHYNYYSAWCYVTKYDTDYQESEEHPDLRNTREPKTSKASATVQSNSRKRSRLTTKSAKDKMVKKKRLSPVDVSEILLAKNITTTTELQALAYEQKQQGKLDLTEYILKRSPKAIRELIQTTWEMKGAGEKLKRARMTRLQILEHGYVVLYRF